MSTHELRDCSVSIPFIPVSIPFIPGVCSLYSRPQESRVHGGPTFIGFDASKRAEERPMKCLMMTVLLSVVTAPAWAQEPGDAPEHGVARISMMSGDVTVRRGDSGEDVVAESERTVGSAGSRVHDQGSRAELQFDSANFLRLAPDSEVRLAELADRDYLVQLSAGR